MKKTTLFFLVLGLVTSKVCGQFNIGLKAGLNLTNGSFIYTEPKRSGMIRFNFGIVSQIGLSKKFLLRPDVSYSQKGWRYIETQGWTSSSVILHYINIPILTGYKLTPKLSFLLGPELGFPLKTTGNMFNEKFGKRIDYGICVASAYSLTKKLGVEIRYAYGLSPLHIVYGRDSNNINAGEIYRDGFNRVFQVNVFYFLRKQCLE